MRTRVGYCPAYCCHEIGGLTPSVSRLLGSGFGKAPEGFATQELDIRPGYRSMLVANIEAGIAGRPIRGSGTVGAGESGHQCNRHRYATQVSSRRR
jgi:hypothetical protein